MTVKKSKLLIIGSGPAGYTAAIYAARAALKPVLVQGYEPGGQLTVTTDVENWPGFEDVIQGPWLMDQMEKQAQKVGTEIIGDYINSVDFSKKPFIAIGDSGTTYEAETVIVATGAQAKWLGLESETKFRGYGVSGCATCDGFFYKGKDVAVIGGGNTAVEEALYLTMHAKKVTLIHRRDKLRCEKVLEEKLLNHPQITVLWNTVLEEVVGNENPKSVTGLKLQNTQTGMKSELSIDGLFIAIGHKPQTDIFKGQLDMDEEGYLKTNPGTTRTNIPGVFAAGDVQDKVYRQAVTAAGQGCMAALDVVRLLED
ncbi:MAG: thioredoxin-disulfide reductase [Alphaproteobacteria bacterium]